MHIRTQIFQQQPEAASAVSPLPSLPKPAAMSDPPASPDDLPPANVNRWTIRRKAAVVVAIAEGRLTADEACRRYQLTEEELQSWQQAYTEHGLPGLRSTRLQQYRGRRPRTPE
jgi:hypothetical protein